MSREAWGDPPDPEPQYCPACGGQEHAEGCELGKEVARRLKAEKGLNEWRELALSQAGDSGIVARMVKAETEVALLHAAMRDEMDEGLRLRELGGAMPDENITAMTERLIKERLNLAAMLRKCAHALRNRGREDLAADVVGLLRCYDLLGSPLRDGKP